ncbi:MAG: sulfurtransferase [Methanoregula sp.]|jgi:thiosulfate/3-mercaptopyruvate sulfurtransferase|nr:sulfurtransferase [Methanoregula sp.]
MTGKNSPHPNHRTVHWISTEWLADHLDDTQILIIDCRQSSHSYIDNHIPGALYLHEGLLRMHIGKFPVRWISPEAAQIVLSTIGVEQDRPVVVYSDTSPLATSPQTGNDGLEQTFVAYSLARFGCRNVMILDGGLLKWKSEKRPVVNDPGIACPSAFTVDVQIDFLVGFDECTRLKDEPDVILLDTRPPALYEGQGPWAKPGHIPGAINLPAAIMMDAENSTLLKPEEEIRRILLSRGITPEKTVICSCGTGRSATAVFLVLKYFLGYPDVLIYEAGFTEWSSFPDNPVVTGKNPR